MLMDNFKDGLKHAFRTLARQPAVAIVVVITLSVGIGANAAIFTIVDSVLLRSLPYDHPERIVTVWDANPEQSIEHDAISMGNFPDWRERVEAFQGAAAWYEASRTLRGDQEPEPVQVVQVAGDFFQVLAAPALSGKTFSPADTRGAIFGKANQYISGDRTAVLSSGLWRRRFGADPDIIGKEISIDGLNWQVVGVMPASFAIPDRQADLWVPWDIPGSTARLGPSDGGGRDYRFLKAIAKLAPGVTMAQAQASLSAVCAKLEQDYPHENRGWRARLIPLRDEVVGRSGSILMAASAGVIFLLLIVCTNVAGLMVAKTATRQREIAVRLALGASRMRVIMDLLTESWIMSLIGGALGLLAAHLGVKLLVLQKPVDLPGIDNIRINMTVLLFTFAIAFLTGTVCGLLPALRITRIPITSSLKEGGGRVLAQQRFRSLLVSFQVAIAVVLLVGAALFARSFIRLLATDPGFDAKNLLVMRIFLDNTSYRTGEASSRYYTGLLDQLKALPSVQSVAATTYLPMSDVGVDFDRPYWREGELDPGGNAPKARIRMITPDYFGTMRIPLVNGRSFTNDDQPGKPTVIIINEALAGGLWPRERAVGKRLVINYRQGSYPYEVVGVAGDSRYKGLRSRPEPEVFIPHAQNSYLTMNIVMRTASDPRALGLAAKQEALKQDPAQPVQSIVTMESLISNSVAADRFLLILFSSTALIASGLAALGIYGLTSYLASLRTQEIGVRMALGAERRDVFKLMLGGSSRLMLIGLGIGLPAALAMSRSVSHLLYNTSATDPLAFLCVPAAVAAIVMVAALVPSRRAAGIDPAIALRRE
jgi:putative ABC transport system permease protein